jgi:uncharacterized RDD family membrane protein YckC
MTSPQPAAGWTPPPEEPGPAPGLEFAPHGARLVAYILDALAIGLVLTVILAIGAVVAFSGAEPIDPENPMASPALVSFILLAVVAGFAVTIGYFPWFWARRGQTPGMRVFGLYVVRDRDGGPIDGATALLRLLGYYASSAVFSLGFIWILIDRRRRGWHDLIAGTVVVRRTA